jgi:predicted dehydrogenase
MRWGIIGPGRISRAFLTGLCASPTQQAVAVGSRDAARAAAVAAEFGVTAAYGSYQDVLDDDAVEAVYIGLPNALHAQWTISAVRAGKHVLCEKPLGRTRAEAVSMFDAAAEHGVRLSEAFMYRCHPRTRKLAELVAGGAIGELRLVHAAFGFTVTDTANVRLSRDLAGGALMDVGCYPVNLTRLLAGPVRAARAVVRWADTGVDTTLAATLDHTSGAVSQISCSLDSAHHHTVRVIGTTGTIEMPEAFTPPKDHPSHLLLEAGTRNPTRTTLTFDPVDQYHLEADAFAAAQFPLPPQESVDNATTIHTLLHPTPTPT